MGLAASQARYLLLTARRSDLEYRAQMISQRKIALAMETEQVATAYTKALNNRHLMFTFTSSANAQSTKQEELTYKSFTSDLNTEKYRLVDPASGKILCADRTEATRYVNINDYATFDADGNQTGWKDGQSQDTYNAACEEFYQKNMLKLPALNNKNYLHDAIQAGTIAIERQTLENIDVPVINQETGQQETNQDGSLKFATQTNISWESVLFAGMDDVSSELYTKDDSAAMAEYEKKSLLIQNQDKQLDVELKQVETQLEACKAEQESVSKLVKDHAGQDFKIFS